MPSPMPRPSSGRRLVPKMRMTMTKRRTISGKPRLNMTFPPGNLAARLGERLLDDTSLSHVHHPQGLVQAAAAIPLGVDQHLGIHRGSDRLLDRRAQTGLPESANLAGLDLDPRRLHGVQTHEPPV